jgi:cytochrome P450
MNGARSQVKLLQTPLPSGARLMLNPLARSSPTYDNIPMLRGRFPLAGHLPALFGGALELMRLGEREHGSAFWLDLGFGNRAVCVTHRDAYQLFKSKATSSQHARERPAVDFIGEQALLATDGAEHTRVRKALNPTFAPHGITALELGPAFAEIITTRLNGWAEHRSLELLTQTRELVLSLMFRMAGVAGAEVEQWRKHYEHIAWLALPFPELPGTPKWHGRRSSRWLDARIGALLAEARAAPERSGLLGALVAARDDDGEPLSDRQLIDNTRLLFLAGHETSASTMAWATAICAVREDVWEQLTQEALDAPDVPRTPADLKAFPFAEAVFRETLRLYPPASIDMRRVVAPVDVGGITLTAGTNALLPIVHLSRDPEIYPEPDSFVPERWLHKRGAPTAFELIQFGAGHHFCIGYHVAWLEIVQYLVALARTLGARGLRPRLEQAFPSPRFVPVASPPARLRIRFA